MKELEEIEPKHWTSDEAFHSGQTAYRIGVLLSSNPFQNTSPGFMLADDWVKGWNQAQENDPKQKRVIYAEERPDDKRRQHSRDSSRDSFSRNKHTRSQR